ncbi:glycosyl transferase family 2 [Mergibacter septicus]|uniref:glycosyltransferase family 2 protein n=1 Tax=Mergibacter septicus TaxID=221402 RepID=UPI001178D271|nr:glycosyltransferase family A protein [Mergibacter septicus]AWX13664.1 glycosyl transferase family 2 [Mergibacter septicus]
MLLNKILRLKRDNILKLFFNKFVRRFFIPFKIYFYFKLGMYKTVSGIAYKGSNFYVSFAKAISFSAIGNKKMANYYVTNILDKYKNRKNKQKEKLSRRLNPYYPELSLSILENIGVKDTCYYSLLLVLDKEIKIETQEIKTPEDRLFYLNLYNTQSTTPLPVKQLEYLNGFLNDYQLEEVQLIDKKKGLNVFNLTCVCEEIYSEGLPLVSILVTTFNSQESIECCLKSLLLQTYSNIEVIVVDDNSTDNTLEIIIDFIQEDKRIKLISLPHNIGTFSAKNIGLQYVKGEFITCQDSDDYAHPRKIEEQIIPLLEDNNIICTVSDWIRLDNKGNAYSRFIYPIMRHNPASLMFRKEIVLNNIGYWDYVRIGADSEFYERLKLFFGSKSVKKIRKPLTFGAHRENSLMTSKDTGYDSNGLSNIRLEYWEAWRKWHIHCCKNKQLLKISGGLSHRPFSVPKEIEVDLNLVKKSIKELKLYY